MGIQQLGSDKWRLQIRRRNLKVDKVYPTEREAKQAEAKYLASTGSRRSAITVSAAWDLYSASLEFTKKRPRTQSTESGRIKRWLEDFGETPIDAIGSDDVENYIAKRLKAKPTPGSDTVRLEVAAFSALMKHCVRKKYLPANPCIGVPRPSGTRRITRMSKEQIGELMQLLQNPNRRFRYAARLCLLVLATGARPGEWRDVRMSDVDLDKNIVTFRETKYQNQPRTVPLTPTATKLAADQLGDVMTDVEINTAAIAADIMFPSIGRAGDAKPLHYTGALRDAKKQGALPKSVRAHTGRHEFISTLVESSKLDDSRIMALVGHHSPVSMEGYKHVRNVQFRDDLEHVETAVMRPQRAAALAETIDLPVGVINLLLELRRGKEAAEGLDDTGAELLYEPSVIGKLRELAEIVQNAPEQKASLIAWVKERRAQLEREKSEDAEAAEAAAKARDIATILAAISPGAPVMTASQPALTPSPTSKPSKQRRK